jgi:hypothetical protein
MAGGYPINPGSTQATTGTSGRPCFDVHASTPDATSADAECAELGHAGALTLAA